MPGPPVCLTLTLLSVIPRNSQEFSGIPGNRSSYYETSVSGNSFPTIFRTWAPENSGEY